MFETSTQWTIVEPLLCDVCGQKAAWAHPLGGLRCETCPRPEVTLYGILEPHGGRWWPRTFKTFEEAQAHHDRCRGPGTKAEVREYPMQVASAVSKPLRPSSQQTTERSGDGNR